MSIEQQARDSLAHRRFGDQARQMLAAECERLAERHNVPELRQAARTILDGEEYDFFMDAAYEAVVAALASQPLDLGQFRELAKRWVRDNPRWVDQVLTDDGWQQWRADNPDHVALLTAAKTEHLLYQGSTTPPAAQDVNGGQLFYIQDTRSFVGNCPVWWGPSGRGYVTRLDEAGRYSFDAAIAKNRARETDIPWPCSEIDALARPTVDHQHMRPRAERLAEVKALIAHHQQQESAR